ncbi:hypothetical protein A0H81_10448 [Grifola frondosa]|uniref:Uncharacterized protein n=1 Tax=Grifola frondosa TaxID=5627 RepID=A0A1C7LY80_GRIFR|nr:hypothetical protein A0H81_10448 [Grifola frondosa]
MHSIEGSLQVHALRKFEDAMMQGRIPDFFALARFVGELTVNGIVFATDLEGVLDLLFSRTEGNDDDHAVALCRFLSPIVVAPEASQCLEALSIVGRIENVLEEDAISQKIQHAGAGFVSQTPHAFASVEQRTEVYGFGQEANDYGDFNEERKESDARETVLHYCREQTSHFLLSRNVTQAEDSFQKLPSRDRHHLVARLVSVALSSDDCSDTTLVVSLFSLQSVRSLCQSRNSFVKGFEAEIVMLEDTALDVPLAYRRMATMLHASGLTQNVVEDLASRITIKENSARDRLLEEYLSVGRDAGDTAKSETAYDDNDGLVSEFEENVDIVGDADGQVSGSDEGAPSVECAFAY